MIKKIFFTFVPGFERLPIFFTLMLICFGALDPVYADGNFFAGLNPDTIVPARKVIALTFDDGPGATTEEVLNLLRKYRARATFFVLGCNVATNSVILKKIYSDGHEIGNHTYGHINFYTYKKPDRAELMRGEILKTDALIKSAGVVNPARLLRMPYGYNASWSRVLAGEMGYVMVNWSFGCDWMGKSEEETVRLYLENVRPGGILLFHDGGKKLRVKTLKALEAVLEKLSKENYGIVTAGDLMKLGLSLKSEVKDGDVSGAVRNMPREGVEPSSR